MSIAVVVAPLLSYNSGQVVTNERSAGTDMSAKDAKRFAAQWETWTLIPAGAGWMFAVGIIEQGGRRRVRVAKGKAKVADAGELPISQQSKFNLKPADWKPLRDAIDRYIAQLKAETAQDPDKQE